MAEEKAVVKRGRPFKKGEGGRKPGSVNLITKTVKEGVLAQFCDMQSNPDNPAYKFRLDKFAARYPRDFYAMAAKLIPTEIHARINKVELHVIRTGKDLPENFTPVSATDNGHSETIQHS